MANLYKVIEEYENDSAVIEHFCDELYDNLFAEHFTKVKEMYTRLKSEIHPITDEELEYILTLFPMELISVAEKLNKLRLDAQVVKLKNKEKAEAIRHTALTEVSVMDLTKTEKQEYVSHRLNKDLVDYEILLAAYTAVTTRVENEQSFSKELIMGAKKIWDSRRAGESVNPVEPVASEIPEYDRNQYIK